MNERLKLNELIEQLQREREKIPEAENPEVLCANPAWSNHGAVISATAQTVLYPCILINVEPE